MSIFFHGIVADHLVCTSSSTLRFTYADTAVKETATRYYIELYLQRSGINYLPLHMIAFPKNEFKQIALAQVVWDNGIKYYLIAYQSGVLSGSNWKGGWSLLSQNLHWRMEANDFQYCCAIPSKEFHLMPDWRIPRLKEMQ